MSAAAKTEIFRSRIDTLSDAEYSRLVRRANDSQTNVAQTVSEIIDDVRRRGDAALLDMATLYDGVRLTSLEISAAECNAALAALDPDVVDALEEAAQAIRLFHTEQLPADIEVEVRPGVILGRRSEPLDRVGVYAPGGRAAYPSSVLMGVIPARVAGVGEIIVCSPPGDDGRPSPVVLAACAIAGADRVFGIGGAGAIAAMALGTASVPSVARVTGPGNAYVAEAKRQLTGVVAIDSPAGPSEILVIADASADPELIAIEMIAQAEHDADAAAIAIIVDADEDAAHRIRDAVVIALDNGIVEQPRARIIRSSLATRGAILIASSLDEALAFAQAYAPEHLSLMIADPRGALGKVRSAGTVFLGASSSVVFGDYTTGANHVLPTNGLARSYSGLSTLDFVRFMTYQEVSPDAARLLSRPTATLARAEGLPAHTLAATVRGGDGAVDARVRTCDVRAVRFRDAYRDIELYEPGRMPCASDLSDNTNLSGVPPAAGAVLANAESALVTRYPTVYGRELKIALARRHNVDPANIVTGCGSDDILDSLLRAFCNEGDRVAMPVPTFGVVDLFARMNSARAIGVLHDEEGQLDVGQLVRASAAVTYICNPNNPTGTLYTRESIESLVASVAGVLAIDEAYADYSGESAIDLAVAGNRTVVVRTFSKAFGLAGLRIGYAVGSADVVREIEKARGPYKVGALAERAAIAALEDDIAWVNTHIERVVANRERLRDALAEIGIAALPSRANFLLIPVDSASRLAGELRQAGIAVRAFPALPAIGDAIRVTVGEWPVMEQFVNAIRRIRESATAVGVE